MKELYMQPEVETLNLAVEQAILDGSGENLKNKNGGDDFWG